MRAVKPYIISKGYKGKRNLTIRNGFIFVICLSLGIIVITTYTSNKDHLIDNLFKKKESSSNSIPQLSRSSNLSSGNTTQARFAFSGGNLLSYANKLVKKHYGSSYHVANDNEINWSDHDIKNFIKPARQKYPNFPYLVSGDFNGDSKKPDIAVFMINSNDKTVHRLVIFHAGENWQHDLGDVIADGIDFVPKQNLKSHWESKSLKMKGDGVAVFKFESSSVLYYWDGKTYSKYWLSD